MFYYYLAKDNLESFSDSVAPLNYEIAEHFYPVVSIFTMEFIADLLSSEIDKPSLTQKELWRWKYFLYPDISQDIPMEKMPIDVEELMRNMLYKKASNPAAGWSSHLVYYIKWFVESQYYFSNRDFSSSVDN